MAETENICDLRIKQGMDDRENLEFKMNTENNLMVVTGHLGEDNTSLS